MGQLLSSEEDLSKVKQAVGSLLYQRMLEGGAIPDLGVVHPLLLTSQDEDSRSRLQEELLQLQGHISDKAPTYLRDLIGRLSSFSDEPRLAGLLGLAVAMVMDLVYMSSKQPSAGGKGKASGSSSRQRVWELQELMEEYLKRCRMNLSNKTRLVQDFLRLEGQLSLTVTQLKTCLLGGECDSRSLRFWASGAAFHTQMLVHLAGMEGQQEPLAARAVLEQYKEDLTQMVPAYRRYKSKAVSVVKSRGGLPTPCEGPEEGSMTGLTLTDRETGKSVSIALAALQAEIASAPTSFNPDLVTSDQYSQAYVEQLFSEGGPVAQLQDYFDKASRKLGVLRTAPLCPSSKARGGQEALSDPDVPAEGTHEGPQTSERSERDEDLKLSIVETNITPQKL
ncbi:uncharacterized protein LOC133657797 [Entelurus aequoreus]|uniref:uncharacterized protein LOC133657797 n=1 Tax=Entelurus aequoreus TaxID=161455 RepID=UPI002B1D33D7|nr:uncharacterized protein LOC133657797 [Entelurus aequoreus]XP_061915523.1 uncharacterized protein LOC133657797 [Entelurus aequoreus]